MTGFTSSYSQTRHTTGLALFHVIVSKTLVLVTATGVVAKLAELFGNYWPAYTGDLIRHSREKILLITPGGGIKLVTSGPEIYVSTIRLECFKNFMNPSPGTRVDHEMHHQRDFSLLFRLCDCYGFR